jgi:uncharacterized membrane protein
VPVPLSTKALRALALATAFCLLLLGARVAVTRTAFHAYLAPNFLLAWIPVLLALALFGAYRQGHPRVVLVLLGAVWLVFFPNAPYMVTDVIHLWPLPDALTLVYDAILLVCAAVTGLALGLLSLYLVQAVVRSALGAAAAWIAIVLAALATGYGIYLGRFERFNSWQVVSDPVALARFSWEKAANPVAYPGPLLVTLLAAGLLVSSYAAACRLIYPRLGMELEAAGPGDRRPDEAGG